MELPFRFSDQDLADLYLSHMLVLFSIKSTGEWAMDKMIEMIAWNIKMSDM
jgi:hypothetical protein